MNHSENGSYRDAHVAFEFNSYFHSTFRLQKHREAEWLVVISCLFMRGSRGGGGL